MQAIMKKILFYQTRRQQILYLPLEKGWCDPEQYKPSRHKKLTGS